MKPLKMQKNAQRDLRVFLLDSPYIHAVPNKGQISGHSSFYLTNISFYFQVKVLPVKVSGPSILISTPLPLSSLNIIHTFKMFYRNILRSILHVSTMGTGSFSRIKRPRCGADHPPPFKCRRHERVGLYLYSPSGPSWPVIGRTFTVCSMSSLTVTTLNLRYKAQKK